MTGHRLNICIITTYWRPLCTCLPHILFVSILSITFMRLFRDHPKLFVFYCREDGMLESLQFFCHMLSSSLCGYIALEFRRAGDRHNSWLFLLGTSVFLFFGLEEISWGQRLLNYEVPEWFMRNNIQLETNLHNLDGVSNKTLHLLIGLYGTCSAAALRIVKVVFPRYQTILFGRLRFGLCVIPLQYTVYFIPPLAFNRLFSYLLTFEYKIGLYFQEVAEFSCAVGCYLVLSMHLRMVLRENRVLRGC